MLRCTKPVLEMLKTAPAAAAEGAAKEAELPLQEWFANILRLKRRKCLMITSRSTLFTFLVPGVTAPQLRSPDDLIREHLRGALRAWGAAEPAVATLDDLLAGELAVSGTRGDRRVLGSMNELAFMMTWELEDRSDAEWEQLPDVIRNINTSPMSFLKYDSPEKRMTESLQELAGKRDVLA